MVRPKPARGAAVRATDGVVHLWARYPNLYCEPLKQWAQLGEREPVDVTTPATCLGCIAAVER